MVARPGSVTDTLEPHASRTAPVLALASQIPLVVEAPNEGAAGVVAPGKSGGGSAPVKGSAVLPLKSTAGTPDVAHGTTAPRRPPVIRPSGAALTARSAGGGMARIPGPICWATLAFETLR